MNTLNVLHVASFSGNIGDNANHAGFKSNLKNKLSPTQLKFTEYEIREVYWGNSKFDSDFVQKANEADLVVIGGGNYFELWVDRSATGCSIDIALKDLEKIETPIIFNALGVDPAQGASVIALDKFRSFLDLVISKPNMILSCRNDGSFEALEKIVGTKYSKAFYHVPDAGLFTKVDDFFHPELVENKKNVLIQVAGDMLDLRFNTALPGTISFERFVHDTAAYIELLVKDVDCNVILCPHIFRDLDVIYKLLGVLDDKTRRTAVKVAPYLQGDVGQSYIFGLYSKCDLVVAMRFHANLCAMGLGVPTIGLVNYRQIEKLYEEMDVVQNVVECNKDTYLNSLVDMTLNHFNGSASIKRPDLEHWKKKLDIFHDYVVEWLKS